jgi:hypothetical protein
MFITQFDNAASNNKWSDDNKLAHLKNLLKGIAATVIWDIPSDNQTYQQLCNILRQRFGSAGQAEKYRAELRLRKRRTEETLQNLLIDKRCLVTMAFPGPSNPTVELIAKDTFVDALGDTDLILKIRERDPATPDGAYQHALRLEALLAKTDNTVLQTKVANAHDKQVRIVHVDATTRTEYAKQRNRNT